MSTLFNFSGLRQQLSVIAKSLEKVNGNDYNAKFILSVGSGLLEINPDTGNYDYAIAKNVIIKAKLMPIKEMNDNINIGTAFNRMYLEGHLLEPLIYSGEFNNYLDCELLNDGNWLKGKFYHQLNIASSQVENQSINLALGTQIKGYFEINGSVAK
jgi:hypothetical protein